MRVVAVVNVVEPQVDVKRSLAASVDEFQRAIDVDIGLLALGDARDATLP